MAETQTRYTRKKKKKQKRFGFGLSLWNPKETDEHKPTPEQQHRLLRPRTPVVRPPSAPSTQLRRGYLALAPDDRALIEQLRDVTKRSLGDDSQRLDALVSHLSNAGFEVQWMEETETVPAHWTVSHPDFVAPQEEEAEEEDLDEEAPVVRQEAPQEPVDEPA